MEARGVRGWSYLVVLFACWILAACSGDDETPHEGGGGPGVRIIQPMAGAVLAGSAPVEFDISLPEGVSTIAFGIDEDPTPLKYHLTAFEVPTRNFANGQHRLRLRVTDGADRVWTDSVDVIFDNPEHQLVSYELSEAVYAEGDQVTIALRYSHAGLKVTADLSAVDSAAPIRVTAADQGDGNYELSYRLSRTIDQPDGDYAARVRAINVDGREVVDAIPIRLQKLPEFPIRVQGGVFVDRPTPAVQEQVAGGPLVQRVSSSSSLLTGSVAELELSWTESADHPGDKILIAAEGFHGYVVVPLEAAAESTSGDEEIGRSESLELSLVSMKPGSSGQPMDLKVAVVDPLGGIREWIHQTITPFVVSTGGVQVSLRWDTPVDLDLSVTDADGNRVDHRSPVAGGGLLDLDSNARCRIDNKNSENISWAKGLEPQGQYSVHVNLYDACGEQAVNWELTVRACGETQTFSGSLTAGDADSDGSGQEVATFSVRCRQRVHGRVTYAHSGRVGIANAVPVRAVRAQDGMVLAQGTTDGRGRYDLQFDNPGDANYRLELEAVYTDPSSGTVRAQVMPLDRSTPYSHRTGELPGTGDYDHQEDIALAVADEAGAFNILQIVRRGFEWARVHVPSANTRMLPQLPVRWTRGSVTPPPATSYYLRAHGTNPAQLFINGEPSDPDEFDDSVIAHEFMHFLLGQLSFEGPGGPHAGPVHPAHAFSEGLATALGQDVLQNQEYLDATARGAVRVDIETGQPRISRLPLAGHQMTGDIDEFYVSMVVWDLLDPINDDQLDRLSGSVMNALLVLIPQPAYNSDLRGGHGVDLADFLDTFRVSANGTRLLAGLPSVDPELRCVLDVIRYHYDFPLNPGVRCSSP